MNRNSFFFRSWLRNSKTFDLGKAKITRFKPQQIGQTQDAANTTSSLQSEPAQNSINAKKKHDLSAVMGGLSLAFIIGLIWLKYQSNKASDLELEADFKLPLNLEVASNALDIEKMWRNHFEDKLIDSKAKADEKLQLIETSINEQSVAYQNQLKSEI